MLRSSISLAAWGCKVVIEDESRFRIWGRISLAELEAIRSGPRVIKENVQSTGGQLAVDYIPGEGRV